VSHMRDIVTWLTGMEKNASEFYSKAAVLFRQDRDLHAFLTTLAEEETEHLDLLKGAAAFLEQHPDSKTCITLDPVTRSQIESPIRRGMDLLDRGELMRASLIGVVAEAEYSEWNEIFLYVINALRKQGGDYQKAVDEIDRHRLDIEKFLGAFPSGSTGPSRVWKRRILVVEDDPSLAKLLKHVFMAEAEVVLAHDGQEGIAHILNSHVDVVLSDVEMPRLNGIEFYRRAVELDPALKNRFIFFTGTQKPEYRDFLASPALTVLPKPSSIGTLRKVIREVADR